MKEPLCQQGGGGGGGGGIFVDRRENGFQRLVYEAEHPAGRYDTLLGSGFSFSLIQIPILTWTHSCFCFEYFREMLRISKTQTISNFTY